MERSSSSPAPNNAIRGAEQAGNIAKQWFARKVSKVRGFMATRRGAGNKMGSATYNDSIETTKHGNDSKGIQGDGHLA